MKRSWSYLSNPFLNCSNDSYPVMRKVGNYTINALHKYPQDAFLTARHAALAPLNVVYTNSFNAWKAQQASQLSGTASFKTLKKELSARNARKWDTTLQITYDRDSDEYIAFFPHYRIPFQSGTNLSIMAAVATLSESLGKDLAMASLKTEVDAFDTLLKAAFQKQQGEVTGTGTDSDDVEDARIKLGVELYSTLGLMMDHFKGSPEKITNYFDLETIRNHEQSIFRSNIKAGELVMALTHTFYAEEELLFINRGNTPLRVAIVDSADAIPTWISKFVEVHPKSHQTIAASAIGDTETTRFLKVKNMSTDTAGAYTIELL